MSRIKDLVIDSMNNLPELSFEDDVMFQLADTSRKLDNMMNMMIDINNRLTEKELVNKDGSPKKKRGRKTCKMYYEGKEITVDDLIYLRKNMGLTIPQILDNFSYINERNELITNRKGCRDYLNNKFYGKGVKI